MTLYKKIILMMLIPFLAILYLVQLDIRSSVESVRKTEQTQELIEFLSIFSNMVHELQKERGASTGYIGSQGTKFREKLEQQNKLSDSKILQLRTFLEGFDASFFGKSFPMKLEKALSNLEQLGSMRQQILRLELNFTETIDYYTTSLNKQLLDFIVELVSLSSVSQSKEFSAYVKFFQGKELAGIERAIGTNIFAADKFDNGLFERFKVLLAQQKTNTEIFLDLASTKQRDFFSQTMNNPVVTEIEKMRFHILLQREFAEKFQSTFGFAGFIHNFKNFVLRGDPKYRDGFMQSYRELLTLLDYVEDRIEVPSSEFVREIEVLRKLLSEYNNGIETIISMRAENRSVEEIDKAVKVDDDPAKAVLDRLSKGAAEIDPVDWYLSQTRKIDLLNAVEEHLADDLKIETENISAQAWFRLYQTLLLAFIALGATALTTIFLTRSIMRQVGDDPAQIQAIAERIADGDLNLEIRNGTGILESIKKMAVQLQVNAAKNARQLWLIQGIARLNEAAREKVNADELASAVCNFLALYLDVQMLAFYSAEEGVLKLAGSYAFDVQKQKKVIEFGEGMVGQAALNKTVISISDIPADYLQISSSLGNAPPRNIIVTPLPIGDQVFGVIEIGTFEKLTDDKLELLRLIQEPVAIMLRSINAQFKTKELLEETQCQSEELIAQKEQLETFNENLVNQTQLLKSSEENLKQQSEELQAANEELEEKQESLIKQKFTIEAARQEIEVKASELATSSKYKSEFLANMSHELRTPLNSLLILSKNLADNNDGNLTPEQQEDAQIILDGGNDLLILINDIMDLSKVEAGKLDIVQEMVRLEDVAKSLDRLFSNVVRQKNIQFNVEIEEGMERVLYTDSQRLAQILKNFLSNAIKFTAQGKIELIFHTASEGTKFKRPVLTADTVTGISVVDTGMGIPAEKQAEIFESFQQGDGSINRKFGGTGLGLTISRELTQLLGGEIHLQSEKGEGSTFTVYLPKSMDKEQQSNLENEAADISSKTETSIGVMAEANTVQLPSDGSLKRTATSMWIPDDRRNIEPDDVVLLIIEDDISLAKTLQKMGQSSHLKILVANKGRDGLLLAIKFKPGGILLDLGLPDIDGLEVLEQLKENLQTRHIPVHVMSGRNQKVPSLQSGAVSFRSKPIAEDEFKQMIESITTPSQQRTKHILVLANDEPCRETITQVLDSNDLKLCWANDSASAIDQLTSSRFDCLIIYLSHDDEKLSIPWQEITGHTASENTSVIVYTDKDISAEAKKHLDELSSSAVMKTSDSSEKLLDDVSIFLHRMSQDVPPKQQEILKMLHDQDAMLVDRRVLVVDDDMRNLYALKSLLNKAGLKVTLVENGQLAIDKIHATQPEQAFQLIIMDIMMPVKDGYEAMQEIRQMPDYVNIPILAVTANAMPEDRAKCLAAGASDYLEKPVDVERLMSMLRVWLYQRVQA